MGRRRRWQGRRHGGGRPNRGGAGLPSSNPSRRHGGPGEPGSELQRASAAAAAADVAVIARGAETQPGHGKCLSPLSSYAALTSADVL